MTETDTAWWARRGVLGACVLLSLLPLLFSSIPPLVDLPGHMGRYAVQLNPGAFREFYSFKWQVIGNLGVDLLIEPIGRVFGVELGTKLIVMAIPTLTTAAMLWIAYEAHGRVPPTAFFALPLAWGHPFIFGFVNFALSMALALLAFALWLRMARLDAVRLRTWLFVPISCVIWTAHTFGWGVLGILCFSAELVRRRDDGDSWFAAAYRAALVCAPMALPLIPMLLWRSTAADTAEGWFDFGRKWIWFATTLRDRWQNFDVISIWILVFLILFGLASSRLTFTRNLRFCAIALLAVFLLLPWKIFGSAYADMRLGPYVFAIAILAIRPKVGAPQRFVTPLAIAALAFFATRIAAQTTSFTLTSARYDRALVALDHVPRGARLATFVMRSCTLQWSTNRMEHMAALGIVRRQTFSNDQWDVTGANLMTIVKADAPGFSHDPSQMVVPRPCAKTREWKSLNASLTRLPRAAYDYLWLIDIPRYDVRRTTGMTRIWTNGTDHLFRIDR